jgi:hypothetical protein
MLTGSSTVLSIMVSWINYTVARQNPRQEFACEHAVLRFWDELVTELQVKGVLATNERAGFMKDVADSRIRQTPATSHVRLRTLSVNCLSSLNSWKKSDIVRTVL